MFQAEVSSFVFVCSEQLPDDGTSVSKHVAVLYLLFNVFY
jgi:hypothetical protein